MNEPATTNSTNNSRLTLLLIVLLAVAGVAYWGTGTNSSLNSEAEKPASPVNMPTKSEILSVELLEQNFWEAKLKVRYALSPSHKNGYLGLSMKDLGGHHTVGTPTYHGTHTATALLSRHANRPNAYEAKQLKGRMYDPYKSDRSYYDKEYDIALKWPSETVLASNFNDMAKRYSGLSKVVVYRNIPDYIAFAEKLVAEGFAPSDISMHLAVCPRCKPSLIFGNDVPIAALQSVFKVLEDQDYDIEKIEYSTKASDAGSIFIGQTPGQESKSISGKVSQLMASGLSDAEFFDLIGFKLESNEERAIELHRQAKNIIDYSSRTESNRIKAAEMLNKALELDPNYMPIYMEVARTIMRSSREFNEWEPSEPARKAKQILLNSLKIDPDFASTYVLLGYVQTILHEYDDAKASYQKAERMGTKNLWLHNNRALWYRHHGDIEQAKVSLRNLMAATNDTPDNTRARYYGLSLLAKFYIGSSELEKAKGVYEVTQRDFPNDRSRTLSAYLDFLFIYDYDEALIASLMEKAEALKCRCLPRVKAMEGLYKAAEQVGTNRAVALTYVTRAQAYQSNFPKVIAGLAKGSDGRQVLTQLMGDLLLMKEVENIGSVLSQALDADVDTIEFLLKQKADPNLLDGQGFSPLMRAVYSADADVIKILIQYGGDVDMKNGEGWSARSLARQIQRKDLAGIIDTGAI